MSSLPPQFFIRRYHPDDKYSILMLEAEAFNEHNPYEYIHFYEVFLDGFFVFVLNGDVVGFIVGYALSESEGHIFSLAVSRFHRNRGIAEHLIDYICAYFRIKGLQKASLEVRVSNRPAIRLYSKLGFDAAWIESRYYSDGEDGYVMMVNLNAYFFRKEQIKFGETRKKGNEEGVN